MMRVGILFGGPSREREIAFAGGRTIYDNLDKNLFEVVPIFVDSHRNYIILDWQYLYKGTIRDFYPPARFLPEAEVPFQVYVESLEALSEDVYFGLRSSVGQPIEASELPHYIDFAFLALHGEFGEDGQIQGLLESLAIPYSGSGVRASSIGMDKGFQKKLMQHADFAVPEVFSISKKEWLEYRTNSTYWTQKIEKIGFPFVVRPANQGSSIGVSIVAQNDFPRFQKALDGAFFIETLDLTVWAKFDKDQKTEYLKEITDIRSGIGFPLTVHSNNNETIIYHPSKLWELFDNSTSITNSFLLLEGHLTEQTAIVEAFIHGKEFSCVVIRHENGTSVALPPTEIIKGSEVFDYRSKYLAGLSRKQTPIDLPNDKIEAIRKECERLFEYLEFNVYARIDGFIQEDGTIYLNDPNTTSGMLPSSFFFHQAAEIGLNPSQFLTYIIRMSLWERARTQLYKAEKDWLAHLDAALVHQATKKQEKKRIGVLLGGYSSERHISVESGRNIYEKLASSSTYLPIPIFLTGEADNHLFYKLPVNLLLKDNADDIRDKAQHYKVHPIIENIQSLCLDITKKYAPNTHMGAPKQLYYNDFKSLLDGVFIALHGRPGEDGEVQQQLQAMGIPFNGSLAHSANITIDKYQTLQKLKANGLSVTNQLLVDKQSFIDDPNALISKIENQFVYPLIAKPVDDGCSSAVKKIKSRKELNAFLETIFRNNIAIDSNCLNILHLKPKEEFPQKQFALLEALIEKENAVHFLEITGGLLTHYNQDGSIKYEIFEPSEALASGEVLSLEEKFLAGEGQNITPARFVPRQYDTIWEHYSISKQVRQTLEKAAKILNVTGYARIDAFVRVYEDGRAETIVIEVNSLPGMTPATCIFHQCALNGYKPFDFIDRILKFGTKRNQQIVV